MPRAEEGRRGRRSCLASWGGRAYSSREDLGDLVRHEPVALGGRKKPRVGCELGQKGKRIRRGREAVEPSHEPGHATSNRASSPVRIAELDASVVKGEENGGFVEKA